MEFEENLRKETPEPDLVPIVDCMVSVIFFLLFSTTFIELTKLTLPPSAISKASPSDDKLPLTPKFYLDVKGPNLNLLLSWAGKSPGSLKESVFRQDSKSPSVKLEDKVRKMAEEFKREHVSEKSIQVALSAEANYQELITVMDGLRKTIDDIVLMSPDEVKRKDVQ
ncbi:MAG: biopolymer transporter ExbD [Bdellovibrionota bacterium]